MNTLLKSLIVSSTIFLFKSDNVEKAGLLSDKSKVVYNLSDNNQLNGVFAIYQEDKLFLRGKYKENIRSGDWYCFNPDGSVFLRYNYDLKKLIALDSISISKATVVIKSADKKTRESARIPIPVCSIEQYVSLLGTDFKRNLLRENKEAAGSLSVDLVATIDKVGKAYYVGKYVVDGINTQKKINVNEKLFNIEWIPASYEGKPLTSTFTVNMKFDMSDDPTKRQRFIWNY
jgi:hypothetical protein